MRSTPLPRRLRWASPGDGFDLRGIAAAALGVVSAAPMLAAANPVAATSEIALDLSIVPRARSTLPGYGRSVEQCGEFVYRYFRAHGHAYPDYPTLGQPAEYVASGSYKPSFPAFRNGSHTPPRAGDILTFRGPPMSGLYHTALIYKVEADAVWVYQANLPIGNASPIAADHTMKLPLLRTPEGRFVMPKLESRKLGMSGDVDVVGWIHPTGQSRLPGAPE
ncbi:MAG: CHAP domain-containing protein [Deltaproteobacteria bacterium]|nr:CHAP domain-containing protein [Deltaproteobacteria bacterium]